MTLYEIKTDTLILSVLQFFLCGLYSRGYPYRG